MKAIQVRYLCPTDTMGTRLKAFTGDQSITISRDYAATCDQDAERAALALCEKMDWRTKCGAVDNVPQQYRDYMPGELIMGVLKNCDYVFCFPCSTVRQSS